MGKILLLFILQVGLYGAPAWLYNVEHDKKCEIVGYGVEATLVKAKQNAISDIAQYISVDVKSDVDLSTSDVNGDVKSSSSVNLKTSSSAKLSGVEFIKVEKEEGIWYVAAKYDNSPLKIKLKKLLGDSLVDEPQNKYLKTTFLIQDLNKEIHKKLNYKILRKDGLWQLQYKEIFLPLAQEDFYKLFSTYGTKKLSIIPNQKIYKENDEMFFTIKHTIPGYISILYVENNGKVGVLLANFKSNHSFTYPDVKNEDVFQIANPYNKAIRELYVVVHSKEKVNLHRFETIGDSLLDESNYNFDRLINKLEDLNFSTYEIKIRK